MSKYVIIKKGLIFLIIMAEGLGALLLMLLFLVSFIFTFMYVIDIFYCIVMRILKKKTIKNEVTYTRYTTPMIQFLFSFMTIYFIYSIINNFFDSGNNILIISGFIYLTIYFLGMGLKLGGTDLYNEALDANEDFLRLSFIIPTFLVTMSALIIGIISIEDKINEIIKPQNKGEEILGSIIEIINNAYVLLKNSDIGNLILPILFITVFLSLPIQLISYFLIKIIRHFQRNSNPYKILSKKILRIILWIMKLLVSNKSEQKRE